jgi:hypothetical protein
MASTPIGTVLNAALVKSRKKLIFASMKANVLYAWMFANDKIEFEDGGREITNPLITGRNPNVTSYEYYDELPITQTSEFTTARYNFSRVAGSVMISDQEEDENQGETEIFKILKGKMDALEESIKEKFSSWLYGVGAGKDPNGLALLVPDDPTTGVVGGIDRATESQWRTMATDMNGTITSSNIEEVIDDILIDMKAGKENKPDIIIAGRDLYRAYRKAIRDKKSIQYDGAYSGVNKMLDLGFDAVSFAGINMVYDEDCPSNKMYFLNTNSLKLHILRHANMKIKELNAPWTQDVTGRRVIWEGQLCLWKANRTQAVVIN